MANTIVFVVGVKASRPLTPVVDHTYIHTYSLHCHKHQRSMVNTAFVNKGPKQNLTMKDILQGLPNNG